MLVRLIVYLLGDTRQNVLQNSEFEDSNQKMYHCISEPDSLVQQFPQFQKNHVTDEERIACLTFYYILQNY